MKRKISSILALIVLIGSMIVPAHAEEAATLNAFESMSATLAKLGGTKATLQTAGDDAGRITDLNDFNYFYFDDVDFGNGGIGSFEFKSRVPNQSYYSNVIIYVSVIDGYTDGCIESVSGQSITLDDTSNAKVSKIAEFTQTQNVNNYTVNVANGKNIIGKKAVVVTYKGNGGYFESIKFTGWTAPTAYAQNKTADAAYRYSCNPMSDASIAGNNGSDEYSYAIFNTLDFGENSRTEKYAKLTYGTGGLNGACVSVISFGDYEYTDGDTVTWSGNVPTIARGTETFVGTMLLTDSKPPATQYWAPSEIYKMRIKNLTNINTVMIAVKGYGRINAVEFSQEAKTAYKSYTAADSDLLYTLETNGDITGKSGSSDFAYAIYNNLDFGTDETTEKYIKETYGNRWQVGYLYVFDMGNYEYQDGDTIAFENNTPIVKRAGENTGTGLLLMAASPAISTAWGGSNAEIVRPVGKLSGTHTIMIALQQYIRVSKFEFVNTPITKDAYSDVLNMNNAEDCSDVTVYVGGSGVGTAYFGNLDAFKTIKWKNVDFGDNEQIVNVKINASIHNTWQKQPIGVLIDGIERGKFIIASTGGWTNFQDFTESLSGTITGVHDVELRFYAEGTGSITSLTFEKAPYRVDFNEANQKINVTFAHNSELSENIGADCKLVLGIYDESTALSDVALSEDEIIGYGIETASAAIKLPSVSGRAAKAFMFDEWGKLKPFMPAVTYTPKHTDASINAMTANNILQNTWDFSSCGIFINDINSNAVKSACKDGWIHIGNMDFGSTGAEQVYINLFQKQGYKGSISIYADSLDSEPVAMIETDDTVIGSENNPSDFEAILNEKLTGIHDIYIKFNTDIRGELYTLRFTE